MNEEILNHIKMGIDRKSLHIEECLKEASYWKPIDTYCVVDEPGDNFATNQALLICKENKGMYPVGKKLKIDFGNGIEHHIIVLVKFKENNIVEQLDHNQLNKTS